MKTTIEARIFRLELMLYFVVGKLGFDTIKETAPLINSIWRILIN